jgi:hypothetical protein
MAVQWYQVVSGVWPNPGMSRGFIRPGHVAIMNITKSTDDLVARGCGIIKSVSRRARAYQACICIWD